MSEDLGKQDVIDETKAEGQAAAVEVVDQASADENGIAEIESLCMNCHDNGMTRLKMLHIPFFHEVLLESFSCDSCGHANNTIKPAGKIQEKGSRFTFRLDTEADFQRQVMKSDSAIFRIEDLELEMPSGPGQLTDLEGLLTKILVDLQADQPRRKTENPTLHQGLEQVVERLTSIIKGTCFPTTVSLDDISGNSSIEPSPSDKGTKYTRIDYSRSLEQNISLGLATREDGDGRGEATDPMRNVDLVDGQIYEIPSPCPGCSKDCTINVKKVKIPHFKEVVIMSTVCEHCGYTTREVKTGGEIPDKGQRIKLMVENVADLSRDVLKSETCALSVPELGLEVQAGTMGGKFTTVEGLLSQIREQLHGQVFDLQSSTADGNLAAGDSMPTEKKQTWEDFFTKLRRAIRAEIHYSIVLEDPLANSYVQSLVAEGADAADDRQLLTEEYERTSEEIEDLGLADMQTEHYETEGDQKEAIQADAEKETDISSEHQV